MQASCYQSSDLVAAACLPAQGCTNLVLACSVMHLGRKLDFLVPDDGADHNGMHATSSHFSNQSVTKIVPTSDLDPAPCHSADLFPAKNGEQPLSAHGTETESVGTLLARVYVTLEIVDDLLKRTERTVALAGHGCVEDPWTSSLP